MINATKYTGSSTGYGDRAAMTMAQPPADVLVASADRHDWWTGDSVPGLVDGTARYLSTDVLAQQRQGERDATTMAFPSTGSARGDSAGMHAGAGVPVASAAHGKGRPLTQAQTAELVRRLIDLAMTRAVAGPGLRRRTERGRAVVSATAAVSAHVPAAVPP